MQHETDQIYPFHLMPIILIAAVSMVLSALLLWNSSALKRELARSTEEYVMDVSAQLAGDISSRLDSFQQALESVACTLSPFPDQNALQASLNRQAQILGFDALAVIAPGGAPFPRGFQKSICRIAAFSKTSFPRAPLLLIWAGRISCFRFPWRRAGRPAIFWRACAAKKIFRL